MFFTNIFLIYARFHLQCKIDILLSFTQFHFPYQHNTVRQCVFCQQTSINNEETFQSELGLSQN